MPAVLEPPPISYHDTADDLRVTLHEPDARVQHVPEAVIQDLWHGLRFRHADLRTVEGEPVEVWHPGALNTDAGPDFTGARLHIGGLAWSGDVEVHRTSGEWVEHRHDADPRYDRVVLHVTLVPDRHTGRLRRSDGTVLPEVVLYPHLQDSLRALLHRFYAAPPLDLPCARQWPAAPEALRRDLVRACGRERLTARRTALAEDFLTVPDPSAGSGQALDQLLWERTLRALGYAKNAEPLERLARIVPLRRLRGLADLPDAEALLFGAAGLLPASGIEDRETDAYVAGLRARFERLAAAEPVRPINPTAWTRAGRAPSLPARRIAQAAALAWQGGLFRRDPLPRLVEAVRSDRPLAALRRLLTDAAPGAFWTTHVRLDRACKPMPAGLGRARADAILTNAVLPVLLLWAEQADDTPLDARLLDLYGQLPAASDEVTRRFECLGTAPQSALEAQGLHHLYRTRCTQGRCLTCPVGQWVVSGGEKTDFQKTEDRGQKTGGTDHE